MASIKGDRCLLGNVVKSNSHCDYVVQLNTDTDVRCPPGTEDYGFGQFVSLETQERHWAVGVIYDSQLFNPTFLSNGPRLTSEPDPIFTPDRIQDVQTLLSVVLVGNLIVESKQKYGQQGIPKVVVPVNTPVYRMQPAEIHRFHLRASGDPQFCYYSHLMRCGGPFSAQLTQQVLSELIDDGLFSGADQRALEVLCKELSWKNTMGAMR
ncbi:MAG: hypothetical protein AAFV72_17225 [Cyanobacteria bacterium J06635_1]